MLREKLYPYIPYIAFFIILGGIIVFDAILLLTAAFY